MHSVTQNRIRSSNIFCLNLKSFAPPHFILYKFSSCFIPPPTQHTSHDRSCDQKEEDVKDQEVPKSEIIKCTEKSPVCLDYSGLTICPDIGRFYKTKSISGKMFI